MLDLINAIHIWDPYAHRPRFTFGKEFKRKVNKTDIPVDYKLLKNLLISLSPQLRHSILFRTNYSRFKQPTKSERYSSDLIGYLICDLKRRLTIDYDAFFDLLDYLIEESKIVYGYYTSLTMDIIPKCSAVNYLLRYCRSFDHLATFLTKYASIIRELSQANRLKLLVDCIIRAVDIQIITLMISLGIIDNDTIQEQKTSKEIRSYV